MVIGCRKENENWQSCRARTLWNWRQKLQIPSSKHQINTRHKTSFAKTGEFTPEADRTALMRIGGAQSAPPPSQTGQADLPHPAFQSAAIDGLAQACVPRC